MYISWSARRAVVGPRPFVNKELAGEALAPVPDQVVIAAKFGFAFDDQGRGLALSLIRARFRHGEGAQR
jgi:aryl-alcohol dehydrogenase-like predicted oxidoreductase